MVIRKVALFMDQDYGIKEFSAFLKAQTLSLNNYCQPRPFSK
jgi:hypothetical protein